MKTKIKKNRIFYLSSIHLSLVRKQDKDRPLLVAYSLVGNDVCNGHPDTFDHMTKPDEMYNNVVTVMEYLDTVLPSGSHVFLTGLANGMPFYVIALNKIRL